MSKLHHLQHFVTFALIAAAFGRSRRGNTAGQKRYCRTPSYDGTARNAGHETDFTVPRVQTAHVGTVEAICPLV